MKEVIPLSVAWDAIGGLVDAHERFLSGARVDSDVRDSVLDSWKRCQYAGVEPDRLLIPYAPDLTLDHRFLHAAEPVLKALTASLAELNTTVALCDGQARMIRRYGGDRALRARLDGVNFAPGFDASERVAGTNGVGTALAGRSPVYVAGREHFADCLQPFACAGAPIRNPLSGRIEAVLDLTCLHDDGDPAMMRLVREAVRDIETRLLEQATERERALLTAYRRADHGTHGPNGTHTNEGPADGWPSQVQIHPSHVAAGHGPAHADDALGPIDLAVLREKAEALIATPHRTLDEVVLSGGRTATLLRRRIEGAAGESGVVIEARVLGGPRLRHTGPVTPPAVGAPPGPVAGVPAASAVGASAAPVVGVPATSVTGSTVTPAVSAATNSAVGASSNPVVGVPAVPVAGPPAGPVARASATQVPGPAVDPAVGVTTAPVVGAATTSVAGVSAPPVTDASSSPVASAPAASVVGASATPVAGPTTAVPVAGASAAHIPAAPAVDAPSAPQPTRASPVVLRAVPDEPAPSPVPTETDAWLLLVGEPGVGRLAVLARRRLELLHDAGVRIGTTLDVARTAEELTEVAVPRFADFAAVDLPDSVLRGEEPGPLGADTPLRRVALGAVHEESWLYGIGDEVRYVASTPQARALESRQPVLEPALTRDGDWIAQDPVRGERVLRAGIHSLIAVPLRARGTTLGAVQFYRSERPAPFEEDDLSLAQELAGRAAICVDNARRYTRERNTALALQRSLLPRGRSEQNAVEVAYRYLPAQAGVGGDWFDVIPLSGARVALVVGDVVGHGLHAAATMGRLRTAVHNFCALDLAPEELLTHLDDLVGRLDRGEGWAVENTHQDSGIIGATCLYAVYDPVSRRVSLTRAGHPVPAIVAPDGTVDFVDLPPGPPLGLGGTPFETVELELAEGSQLVLYTDGLIEDRLRDIDVGMDRLRTVLACAGRAPEDTCEAVLDALLPARPADDVALLVARTHALGPDRVAQWPVPRDPAFVSHARAAVTDQLTAWGLEELAFSTELVASELITNALRHASGPVQLRLLRDRALICEVSDGSSTSPRLRRARTEDEGGRGLFLVAQLAERWGTRYTADGKIIWTEQPLP